MGNWFGSTDEPMEIKEERMNYFITENNYPSLDISESEREKLVEAQEKLREESRLKLEKQKAEEVISEKYKHHWNW